MALHLKVVQGERKPELIAAAGFERIILQSTRSFCQHKL